MRKKTPEEIEDLKNRDREYLTETRKQLFKWVLSIVFAWTLIGFVILTK